MDEDVVYDNEVAGDDDEPEDDDSNYTINNYETKYDENEKDEVE